MANLNKVMLIGRLTRDPELRYTPSGVAVCDLSLAVSRNYKTQSGERKEDVCFVDITIWRKQAETCVEYLKKGSEIYAEGILVLDKWESQDGQKRSKLRVQAQIIQFLGSKPRAVSATEEVKPTEDIEPTVEGPESETPF